MIPLQLIAIGLIAVGTVLLGVDHKSKATRNGANKKHDNRGGAGNRARKPSSDHTGADGARRVGPPLKGVGQNVRLVPDEVDVDAGDGAGDDSGGQQDTASRPDTEPPVDHGDPETESGGAAQHKEGASGEPSPGTQKTRKKKKAVKDA